MEFHTPYADLLPPLSITEFAALKADIINNGGVHTPIVVDENNNILDGHHRYKIDQNAPFQVISGLSMEEKIAYVLGTNMKRRNLSVEQKKELRQKMKTVAIALNKAGKTQEQIAVLLGIDRTTVSNWLNSNNVNNHIVTKSDGRIRLPINAEAIILNRTEAGETQAQIAADYGVTQRTIGLHIEKAKKKREDKLKREALIKNAAGKSDKWHIYQANMQGWNAPHLYDFIITDPPYPKEYLSLYEQLAVRANVWLKPDSLLIVMCGESYLDQIMAMMTRHIKYYWMAAYLTPGQPTPLRQRQVNTCWKPLIIFSNGNYQGKKFSDVFSSAPKDNDKRFHKWGQSVSGMYSLISMVCLPGQAILDPFCGAGTTGIAALMHGCLFDGIDIEQENVDISKGRLAEYDQTTER